MSADKELWKTGKSTEDVDGEETRDGGTLDLSSPSPDTDNNDEVIEKALNEPDEDNWLPLLEKEDGVSIRTVGLVGTVTILLLTGVLVLLLNEQKIEISVPYEKYEEMAVYGIEGTINFESMLDVPLPIGFIDNDVVINDLDISFTGELEAGIKAPSTLSMDGYGNMRSVFKKYLEQNLDDIDGTITEEGLGSTELKDGQIVSFQHQFVDVASLEIIRSEIESNASYSATGIGEHWYWQSATDWVPRNSNTGLLPHGNAYIGKTLREGDTGTIYEGGIEFNWKVKNGGKIDGEQTALLEIETSYQIPNPILGYEYQYQYSFHFYMSEISSLPLKFEMSLYSDASSPGGLLYSISMEYKGTATQVDGGYVDVPRTAYKTDSTQKTGEFENWTDGAPAIGNSLGYECGIDSNFTLQTGIQKGKEDISEFDSYLRDQNTKNRPAFIVEANYTARNGGKWNFTMAHTNEQSENIDGWIMAYNRTDISGNVNSIDNPIMTMDDIPEPLTVCSAEEVMTDFDEVASWSVNDQTKNVDYSQVTLLLGQNLVSKQSLASPTSIVNFGSLNLINIVSDLSQGNLNPSDYSDNIDVNAAGSYAYFLDRRGSSENLGYEHQELAGVDAKDGLVLFNLQSRNSV